MYRGFDDPFLYFRFSRGKENEKVKFSYSFVLMFFSCCCYTVYVFLKPHLQAPHRNRQQFGNVKRYYIDSQRHLRRYNLTQTEGGYEASTSITETSTTENITTQPNSDISMDDALFIGDSRTVGLMEYAGIDGADYFWHGGNEYGNIHKKPVSSSQCRQGDLTELLNSKKYGKIYILLGINEVGYKFSNTIEKYRSD